MVSIRCSECNKKYKFKETALGKNFDCKCGHQFVIEEADEEDQEERGEGRNRPKGSSGKKRRPKPSEEASGESPRKSGKAPGREIDLTDTKICSKCKAIVELSAVNCPKCDFNLLGLNYDEQHRKEITRGSTKVIYQYGKYLAPLILFGVVYFYAFLQKSKITDLKAFEKILYAKLDKEIDLNRKNKAGGLVQSNWVYSYTSYDDQPHFIPVAKDGSDELSIMGSGFFSFRTPGVCLKVGHTSKRKSVLTYYIQDPETGKPKEIKKSEYEFVSYSALAYFFFY